MVSGFILHHPAAALQSAGASKAKKQKAARCTAFYFFGFGERYILLAAIKKRYINRSKDSKRRKGFKNPLTAVFDQNRHKKGAGRSPAMAVIFLICGDFESKLL
jgi:hypothetical protein